MPIQQGRTSEEPFGATPDGVLVQRYTLANAHGIELRAITYGGIITSLRTPDRRGKRADIVLGFDTLQGYLPNPWYLGAIVGRYANRIARGRFTLDGTTHQLATNHGAHHLHGGARGFDQVVWRGASFQNEGGVGVSFTHTSPDGDEGYPGTLDVRVTYTLTDRDELVVDYGATTDRATPVNLTQHSYFNLSGDPTREVLDHSLAIDADRYTPVDAALIPTGALRPVAGTPFDFRTPRAPETYDHNFVLNRDGEGLVHAARLVEPGSGRTLDISTTEPGIQLYAGQRLGVALETQHFPDSPNQPGFPSTILRPGEAYRSQTVFRFGLSA
jgi:aldose 1-epimerase